MSTFRTSRAARELQKQTTFDAQATGDRPLIDMLRSLERDLLHYRCTVGWMDGWLVG